MTDETKATISKIVLAVFVISTISLVERAEYTAVGYGAINFIHDHL